jgi:hypothetical protein
MTRTEKLIAIVDMGVNIKMQCSDICYAIKNGTCRAENSETRKQAFNACLDCWIDALEGQA